MSPSKVHFDCSNFRSSWPLYYTPFRPCFPPLQFTVVAHFICLHFPSCEKTNEKKNSGTNSGEHRELQSTRFFFVIFACRENFRSFLGCKTSSQVSPLRLCCSLLIKKLSHSDPWQQREYVANTYTYSIYIFIGYMLHLYYPR